MLAVGFPASDMITAGLRTPQGCHGAWQRASPVKAEPRWSS